MLIYYLIQSIAKALEQDCIVSHVQIELCINVLIFWQQLSTKRFSKIQCSSTLLLTMTTITNIFFNEYSANQSIKHYYPYDITTLLDLIHIGVSNIMTD